MFNDREGLSLFWFGRLDDGSFVVVVLQRVACRVRATSRYML
jgi:hypothetical protein